MMKYKRIFNLIATELEPTKNTEEITYYKLENYILIRDICKLDKIKNCELQNYIIICDSCMLRYKRTYFSNFIF